MKLQKIAVFGLALAIVFVMSFAPVWAQEKPKDKPVPPAKAAGTVQIKTKSLTVGVGAEWGAGILTLTDGKKLKFKISGIQIAGVGMSETEATGTVYNLKDVKDFTGDYVAASADASLGYGAGASTMKNNKGVVINLTSTKQGAQITFGPSGMKIVFEDKK
ncbi:MAG: hypothetical protein HQK58_16785 [Deltaproteobacteria bacterium]|nr:hypothetical protein [Deltaproteobacteria bacterium]